MKDSRLHTELSIAKSKEKEAAAGLPKTAAMQTRKDLEREKEANMEDLLEHWGMDARIRDQISEIAELSQFLAEEHAKEPKFVKGKMWNGIQIFHIDDMTTQNCPSALVESKVDGIEKPRVPKSG